MIGQLIGGFVVIFLGILLYLYTTDKRFKKDIHKKIKKWLIKKAKKQKKQTDAELMKTAIEKQTSYSYSEEPQSGGLWSIANLIGRFVVILIGTALLPEISKQINSAIVNGTVSTGYNATYSAINSTAVPITGMSATVLKLVPGFFALGILGVGIALAYSRLKSAEII